jgi:hypothetical protein
MIVAAEVYPANVGDRPTIGDTVNKGQFNLQQAQSDVDVEDVVADKGCYSAAVVEAFADQTPCRPCMPEPVSWRFKTGQGIAVKKDGDWMGLGLSRHRHSRGRLWLVFSSSCRRLGVASWPPRQLQSRNR